MITDEIIQICLKKYLQFMANNNITNTERMVIINMNQPSNEKRLYIYNLLHDEGVEGSYYVSHGVGSSDPQNPAKAINFSNTVTSRRTSLGAMYTGEVYKGKHGKSLKLYGLERGKNDNVARRDITIYPAPYASYEYINSYGYCGRSFGGFAVDSRKLESLIYNIKGGTFVYCYYNEEK